METLYFLGIDVSKDKLDAALTLDGKAYFETEVENCAKAITHWFNSLKKKFSFAPDHLVVCLEHTGVYCNPVIEFLHSKGVKVCMESALHIKRSQGLTRGKNDRIDAQRIASYAFKNQHQLTFWRPQRQCIQRLKALLATRDRLVKIKGQLQVAINECEQFIDPAIHREIEKHSKKTLSAAQRDIDQIEKTIHQLIKDDQSLSEQHKIVSSVPGIGLITSLVVIVATDEFTKFQNPKKFACYAGVAPFEHTSGSSVRGKTRVSKLANMTIKKLLHLCSRSAVTHSEEMKHFYERKIAEGKNSFSVLNAVSNKLITRIFTCVKHRRMYQKNIIMPLFES